MEASIPLARAQSARSLAEKIEAVQLLRAWDTACAIPPLAEIERAAQGWLTVVFFGSARILVQLGLIAAGWGGLVAGMLLWLQSAYRLLSLAYPGWAVFWLVLVLLFALLIIVRRRVFRSLYTPGDFRINPGSRQPVRAGWWLLEWVVRVAAAGLVGLSVLASLFALVFIGLLVFLGPDRRGLLLSSQLLLLTLCALAGLLYPSGLARWLAQRFHALLPAVQHSTTWVLERLRLRWAVSQALRFHQRRNRRQVAGNAWTTVCKNHLLRLKTTFRRMAYGREIAFACCPVCQDDAYVYTGVECLALQLDEDMTSNAQPAGPTLLLNGLTWLRSASDQDAPVFEGMVLRKVDGHSIEAFITAYTGRPLTAGRRMLSQMTMVVVAGFRPEANALRIVTRHFGQVLNDYDLAAQPNPWGKNLRQQGARRERAVRNMRLAAGLARSAVVILLLFGGVWTCGSVVRAAQAIRLNNVAEPAPTATTRVVARPTASVLPSRAAPTTAPRRVIRPSATPPQEQYLYVISSLLNIRAEPGSDQRIVGSAQLGEALLIAGATELVNGNTWHLITTSAGVTGWANGDYLDSQPPPGYSANP